MLGVVDTDGGYNVLYEDKEVGVHTNKQAKRAGVNRILMFSQRLPAEASLQSTHVESTEVQG